MVDLANEDYFLETGEQNFLSILFHFHGLKRLFPIFFFEFNGSTAKCCKRFERKGRQETWDAGDLFGVSRQRETNSFVQ